MHLVGCFIRNVVFNGDLL